MKNKYIREELYDDILSSSNIIHGDEYRELVCAIAQVASDMVVKTLGPYGYTTVIDEGTGFTYPSKDGWTCLSKLQFTDPTYNIIFQMLKKISFNSVTTVGDGTTTAMVAANNFLHLMYEEFIPSLKAKGGFRQATFIRSMENIYNYLEHLLRTNPNIQTINTEGDYSDIYKIAHIATNGNEEFSRIIQKIYQETKNPNIQINLDGNSPKTTYQIQKGYKFNSHVLNYPAYVNDESGSIIYKNLPRQIVIFDHNVTFQNHEMIIGSYSQMAKRDNFEIVIMAPYFDDIVTSWIGSAVSRMVQSKIVPNIMLVQVPVVTQLHRKTISDLAVLTNAQIFDEPKVKAFNILYHNSTHDSEHQIEDSMFKLEQYSFDGPEDILQRCLGNAKSIIFDKSEGFLQDFEDIMNEQEYKEIIREATEDYQERKRKAVKTIGGTLDKDFMFAQMRYIKLTGTTGVINVGAVSDIQQHTDKDTIDDAVLACKSAYENGFVRGMNLEILSILDTLRHDKGKYPLLNVEYEIPIYNMLYKCFYLTSMEVINNKHPDPLENRKVQINDVTPNYEENQFSELNSHEILNTCISGGRNYDYNLRNETLSLPDAWNVINSTATDIEILRAVVNVLTTIITSNQFLSVTRRYDSKVVDEKAMQRRLDDEHKLMENKINAIVDALTSSDNYNRIHDIFAGTIIPAQLGETESLEVEETNSELDEYPF